MDYIGPFAGRKADDYFWGMMPESEKMQPREIPPPHLRDIGSPRIIEMPAPRLRQMPDPRMREMPPVPARDERDPQMLKALDIIREAAKDEAADSAFYDSLIGKAPSAEERQIINGIRDDEKKHFGMFKQLYRELTGDDLPAEQEKLSTKPASYCAGLKKALLGEQNAVQMYRNIMFALTDRRQINTLTEIITDEIRHLGLFNYLYARNKCTN